LRKRFISAPTQRQHLVFSSLPSAFVRWSRSQNSESIPSRS